MTISVSPNSGPKKTSNEQEEIDQSLPTQVARAAFRVATTVHSPESIVASALGGVLSSSETRQKMDELVFEDMRQDRVDTYPNQKFFNKKIEGALERLEKKDPEKHATVSEEYASYRRGKPEEQSSNEESSDGCLLM